MEPSAKVICDSLSPDGVRLTTLEVVMHRFVLAELNTHRVFSRNSASSRAIPVRRQLERVMDDPAIPVVWPSEQPGMQGGDAINSPREAEMVWRRAADAAVAHAEHLVSLGVHKSVTNRLVEPFMWHTVVVTATEWDGFWKQRCSPLAQPEMRAAAEAMREAHCLSDPTEFEYGWWHMPYLDGDTIVDVTSAGPEHWATETLKKISAARCARVSYLTQDGVRDWEKDVEMFDRLVSADPAHASPLEHVARPDYPDEEDVPGNFRGWTQLRHEVLGW